MRRSLHRSIVPALVFAVLLSACSGAPPPTALPSPAQSSGTPYKIGFIASVTGSASFLGEPERDVAVMLQQQITAQGGVIGPDGITHPVQILIHDTEGRGDIAVPLAKKLIDNEGIAILLGPSTSPVSMALIPVVQEAEVPMISMASSSDIVKPVAERKWVFKVAQSNEHTSPWQVRYAQAKGLTKIANLYVNNAYGEDGAEAIAARSAPRRCGGHDGLCGRGWHL